VSIENEASEGGALLYVEFLMFDVEFVLTSAGDCVK